MTRMENEKGRDKAALRSLRFALGSELSAKRSHSALIALMLILALHAPSTAAAGDIAVVVHPRLPLDNLSLNEVRKVVLGDQQFWNGNRRVTLLLRAPVAREREVVLKKVCQMNEAQFRKYWIAKVFRAEAVEGPKVVYSNETALQLVQSLPGAIAFVDADQIPRGLKVLRVDGRLPGETSYPLR